MFMQALEILNPLWDPSGAFVRNGGTDPSYTSKWVETPPRYHNCWPSTPRATFHPQFTQIVTGLLARVNCEGGEVSAISVEYTFWLSLLGILSGYPFWLSFLATLADYPFWLSFLAILSDYPFLAFHSGYPFWLADMAGKASLAGWPGCPGLPSWPGWPDSPARKR